MTSFLSSEILPNLPAWFNSVFKENHRLCLPYALSIRDIDDILRVSSPSSLIFYVDIEGELPVAKHAGSALEMYNLIHDNIFRNAPAESIISFEDSSLWLYFDGDQRYSCLVSPKELIQKAFCNDFEAMKWYFVVQTDDMFLNEELKIQIFEAVTTL